jgi:pyrroline-5-carboxylate reductase
VKGLPWRGDHRLASFCGGVPIDALDAGPATKLRAMAAASIALGESTVLLWPDDATARAILARLGPVIGVKDEAGLDAGTVMYGYYAMLFALMAEGEKWIETQGYAPADARRIVGLAFRGAGGMRLRDSGTEPEAILASLATPGGLTERGLASLNQDGAVAAWSRALDAILRRIKASKRP